MLNKKVLSKYILDRIGLENYTASSESGLVFKKRRDNQKRRFYSTYKLGWNSIQLSKLIHLEKRIPEIHDFYGTLKIP